MGRGAVIAAMAGALLLSACGGGGTATPSAGLAPCPRMAILADGADLTRFRPGAARDLTAMTLDARIAGFEARCDYADSSQRALEVRIVPRFQAERGPAAPGATATLPWFVALSPADDSSVLARVAGTTQVEFAPNVPRATATGQGVTLTMPIGEGRQAADYLVRLSFQLTPEELALNRQRGPR